MKRKNERKAILLYVFFVLAITCQNCALAVNWNSIEVNDVEYYVQTDKSVYELGENVEMLYRITNLGEESVTYNFGRSPEWNFWVDKDGDNTWKAVNGWWTVSSEFTLATGEYIEFPNLSEPLIWDLRDNNGIPVQLGDYLVTGGLDWGYYDFTKVSVPIEVIPEPTTILLMAIGTLGIRLNKQKI